MKEYIDGKFMVVSEKDGLLIFRWKKDTINLTDDYFKQEALKFVDIVQRKNSKRIIVDMREFRYILNRELITWRNKNIIAAYNKIGVEKFAFISEKPTVKQDDHTNTFVTKYFLTEKEAEDWLHS